jgi:hypothetical protein
LLGVNRQGRAEGAKEEEENEEHTTKDDELSDSGVSGAVFGPGATSTTSVFLESIGSELVVDETAESDRVTEELKRCDGVAENEHRGNDEENVLENTAKRKNEGGGSANLEIWLATARRELAKQRHTRKTTETLRPKATMALSRRVK